MNKLHYKKHLEELCSIRNSDKINGTEVDRLFLDALSVLPNKGKLYKYRCFNGKTFKLYCDSLQNNYLWAATPDGMNDKIDTSFSLINDNSIKEFLIKNRRSFIFKKAIQNQTAEKKSKIKNYELIMRVCNEYDDSKTNNPYQIALKIKRKGESIGSILPIVRNIVCRINNLPKEHGEVFDWLDSALNDINRSFRKEVLIFFNVSII